MFQRATARQAAQHKTLKCQKCAAAPRSKNFHCRRSGADALPPWAISRTFRSSAQPTNQLVAQLVSQPTNRGKR